MAFEDILSKLSDLAQTGISKSKDLTEIAKLKMSNVSEEDNIRKAYIEIGKLYYAERGAAPDAGYVALCARVAAAKEKIAYNEEKMADIKAAGSISDADIADIEVEPTEPKDE